MELLCETASAGNKRTSVANQPTSKLAKIGDSRMEITNGTF